MLDGSLGSAAAAIDQIPTEQLERAPAPDIARGADGKFAKSEPAQANDQTEVDAAEGKGKAPDTAAGAEDTADDEDYIELPPDADGTEPQRFKLSEVIDGYRKAQTLEQELAKAREQSPPPQMWDEQIIETVRVRQQHMDAIVQWAQANQPQRPDITLLDPQNVDYSPETYYAQHRHFEAMQQAHANARAQWEGLQQKQTDEQQAIMRVQQQRNLAKLAEVWPELKEETVGVKVRTDLKQHYGLDDKTIDSVSDWRFYAMAKDALAFRSQQAAAKTAAKIVSAKPKLIPGKARSTTTGKAAGYSNAMGRLQQSGSVDDAAAAIASLM